MENETVKESMEEMAYRVLNSRRDTVLGTFRYVIDAKNFKSLFYTDSIVQVHYSTAKWTDYNG